MIKDIHLKNFKCFESITLKQLKTLNVISGKNNFGKTSILDAIFSFYDVKNPAALLKVKSFRNEASLLNKENSFWDSYFYNMDTSKEMSITIRDERSEVTQKYSTTDNIQSESSVSLNVESILSNTPPLRQTLGSQEKGNVLMIKVSETQNGKRNTPEELITIKITQKTQEINGEIKQTKKGKLYEFKTAAIITTSRNINKEATIKNVSKLLTQKRKDEIIGNLKRIDNRINDIAIIATDQNKEIFLDIGLSELNEISMLGEGVSRALSFISSILVQKDSIILIDEIENGIHYSVIKDMINALIEAAKTNNNQIFTTTHSHDVICAINELYEKSKDISYIRLGRDKESQKPTAMQFNMDDFSFSVENGWEVR
ncbi:AAA family ATPase [Salmonella sp. SAL03171]|uniref:AAA family ATPase n=1 Tax=Salmonella sp. SAL03171 TaxID=3159759 RepID=UPI00397CBBB1